MYVDDDIWSGRAMKCSPANTSISITYFCRVKIGFIGCGAHATSSLYPTIHTIPEIDLAAVSDLKEELAEKNARAFGARKWYTSAEEMLSKEELDGVVIVGPPQMHYDVGKQCLDKGLPIFVEKPSAMCYKDALDLARYAKDRNLLGAVGFMKRHATCYRLAKAIAAKKEFGTINEIEIRFANARYPALWGIEEPAQTFLLGQAVHIFDLIRFFCGDVKELHAYLNDFERTEAEGLFGYAVTIRFKNGAVGVLNLNAFHCPNWQVSEYFAAAGYECWLEVKDMMTLNYHPRVKPMKEFTLQGRAQALTWTPEFTEVLGSTAGGLVGYTGEIQNFARAILEKEAISANLFDGAEAIRIAEAIWQSATEGDPVSLRD